MQNPFVWVGNQPVDEKQIATRRALANSLIGKSLDASPVQHWTQGLARVAQAIAGMRQAQFADEDEAARRERGEKAGQGLLAAIGLSPSADASAATAPASQSGLVNVTPPPPQNPLVNTAPMTSAPASAPATGGMQDIMKTSMAEFVQAFPEMKDRITSGYRDPSRNAAVGGAKGSRHIQGDAIDFSVAGLPEDRQQAMAQWWRERGAGGFGYYPNKGAMHVDFGAQRAWGPNYSRTSLGDTPQWFQSFAAGAKVTPPQAATQPAAPALAPQGPTPLGERTLGAVVRNGRADQAAAASQAPQQPPVQVAQAPQAAPAGQAQFAPQLPPRPSNTDAQLAAAVKAMNDPDMPPAYRELAKGFVDRALAARNKDPLETRAKQLQVQQLEAQAQMTPLQQEQARLNNEKARRELARTEMETFTDPATGMIFERPKGSTQAPQPVQGLGQKPAETTSYQKELDAENKMRADRGLPPLSIMEYRTQIGKANAPSVNIDQKQESEFGKKTGELIAKRLGDMVAESDEAAQNQVLIDDMRRLGGRIQTGASAAVTKRLADLGIKLEGASDIEAYSALIDRMTPQQRLPGSGATSDFDAKMFKGSLPSLMNTPEGNKLIIDTMEKLNANRMARGEIAARVQLKAVGGTAEDGALTQIEGMRELRKLQTEARALSDAVKNFGKDASKQGNTPASPQSPATPKRAPSADPLGLFQ